MSTIDLFEADISALKAGGIKGDEESTTEFNREEVIKNIEERKKRILALSERIALMKAEMDLAEKEKRLEQMFSDIALGVKTKSKSEIEEVV
jgi:hypothetical protein